MTSLDMFEVGFVAIVFIVGVVGFFVAATKEDWEMQLTIDINDSAINKILSFLESLKSDVKIINRVETQEIDAISQEEQNYYEELVQNMSEDDRIVSSKEIIQIWD